MKWIGLFCLAATLGCSTSHVEPSVQHIVICWLKQPGDAHARQQLVDKSREFERVVPGLKRVCVGDVLPSTRPAVDATFDLGLVMTFKDQAALDAYQVSEIHQKAVKELLMPLTSKVVIYDFTDERKGRESSSEDSRLFLHK